LLELNMSAGSKNEPVGGETLSALIDGEADVGSVSGACAAWRESASTRTTWHAYHLIGDVMRSEDLAAAPQHDAQFLARLRERLAVEPVVLAPQPLPVVSPSAARRRRTWVGSAAVAAGFVAVAGVLVVMRAPAPQEAGSPMAAASAPADGAVVPVVVTATAPAGPAVAEAAAETEALVRSGQVLRDARLDRYLAAHKQFAGSSALGVPSSFLRSATVGAAGR
jgi:sigma-E factor negative regulatory protein RseA